MYQNAATGYAGNALSSMEKSNYAQQAGLTVPGEIAAPRTIATALSSMDALNDRLSNIRSVINQLCMTIGGPYPASSDAGQKAQQSSGAVGRLNDSAGAAHETLSEIERLLSSIAHSLG